jgi:hypothetical protein
VSNRGAEVVDHEVEDRLNLLFGVASKGRQSRVLRENVSETLWWSMTLTYPFATIQDQTSQIHGSGSDVTLTVLQEAVIDER